jgi:hypothetical protein
MNTDHRANSESFMTRASPPYSMMQWLPRANRRSSGDQPARLDDTMAASAWKSQRWGPCRRARWAMAEDHAIEQTGSGDVHYSWAAATMLRPGWHTLPACLSVIRNFPMGVGGFVQKCHMRGGGGLSGNCWGTVGWPTRDSMPPLTQKLCLYNSHHHLKYLSIIIFLFLTIKFR